MPTTLRGYVVVAELLTKTLYKMESKYVFIDRKEYEYGQVWADWTFNQKEAAMQEYAELYHKEQCNIADVIHWVAVDERLPNEHQDVMVYYYGNRNSKHYPDLQFMKQSSFYNGRFECDEEVTHWGELPEPPCV